MDIIIHVTFRLFIYKPAKFNSFFHVYLTVLWG